jgi:outer membrane protein OmpA-like peptidoglycan-associated protein
MDPALHELVGAGTPSDEVAVLLRLAHGTAPHGARIVARFGDIATARLERGAILRVHDTGGVKSVKAPGMYRPDWIAAIEEADATDIRSSDVRRPPNITQTGRGVVCALIDWGLDVANVDFRNNDGSSRILALWDQRGRSGSRSNNRYGYGWVHDRAAINTALKQRDPYVTLAYHPADAGSGPTHGTHTTGIAAGNGRAGGPPGMAPECDIVFVHLATATGERGDNLGDSVALLEGIDFIARVAGTRPWVLSLSMGRHAGPHDGCTLTEQGMDAAISAAPGRACVQSTGNYFSRPIHTQGVLRPGEVRDIGFHTAEEDGFGHEIDMWYSGRDEITVEVIAPSQRFSGRAETGTRSVLVSEGKSIGRLYNRLRDPNNHDNQAHIYLNESAPRGAWILRLHAKDVVDGRYHCWVERDPACSTCQPSFNPGDVVASSTTGTICNGFLTVAVGAYDPHTTDRPLASFSSEGPTRDGRFKPDIIAPGVQILSSRSAPRQPSANQSKLARMSGTSMAAPFVAGTVALMFQAAGRPLPVRETREMLLKTADAVRGESQSRWGSGYINVAEAIAAAAEPESERPRKGLQLPFVSDRRASTNRGEGESGATEDIMEQSFPSQVDLEPSATHRCVVNAPQPPSLSHSEIEVAWTHTGIFRIEEAITFDAAKSFVFPRFASAIDAAFAGCVDRSASSQARVHGDRAILVTGHTEPCERRSRNTSLSRRRAAAVVGIFALDPDTWEDIAVEECWWDGDTELEVMSAAARQESSKYSSIRRYRRNAELRRRLIWHYLKSLRPSWLAGSHSHPGLVAVIGSPPGVLGCGQTRPSRTIGTNRRAEIYFFPSAYPALHDCSGYRAWQRLDTEPIEPRIEFRNDDESPYTGPFDITLPTGEVSHECTDAFGRWRSPGLPSGRYTVAVTAREVNLLES